jgi:hypothetical protein
MSEKKTLLRSLFDGQDREVVNIKFFQTDSSLTVSEEEFCSQVSKVVFSIRNGLSSPLSRIDEDDLVEVDVIEIAKKLAPCS